MVVNCGLLVLLIYLLVRLLIRFFTSKEVLAREGEFNPQIYWFSLFQPVIITFFLALLLYVVVSMGKFTYCAFKERIEADRDYANGELPPEEQDMEEPIGSGDTINSIPVPSPLAIVIPPEPED